VGKSRAETGKWRQALIKQMWSEQRPKNSDWISVEELEPHCTMPLRLRKLWKLQEICTRIYEKIYCTVYATLMILFHSKNGLNVFKTRQILDFKSCLFEARCRVLKLCFGSGILIGIQFDSWYPDPECVRWDQLRRRNKSHNRKPHKHQNFF
jgi:hypothetical protein